MHGWTDVATLIKAKSLDGRFVARRAAGLSFVLTPETAVAFVPPLLDIPRRATVIDVSSMKGDTYEVCFEAMDRTMAEALVGAHCLVQGPLPDRPQDGTRVQAVLDHLAIDPDGMPLGRIVAMIENPAQSLLSIQREDGSTFLAPFVDEFVLGIDHDGGTVTLDLPEGLCDL